MIVEVKPSRAEQGLMDRGMDVACQVYTCHICGRSCSYKGVTLSKLHKQSFNGVWADTDGKPYKAYLCWECKGDQGNENVRNERNL